MIRAFGAHGHNRTHAPQQTSGRAFPAVSFVYLSVECPFNKFYGINCRPKLGAKLLDRFFHRRRAIDSVPFYTDSICRRAHTAFDRRANSGQPGLQFNLLTGARPDVRCPRSERYWAKGSAMQLPAMLEGESLTRLLQGAFIGFLTTVVIGFNWG
jgi:hypothetical protein